MSDIGWIATPHRSRKDTRRWCGGKVGREHEPEVRRRQTIGHTVETCPELSAVLDGLPVCWHEVFCTECGKVLDRDLGDLCPDSDLRPEYTGDPR